MIAKSLSHLHIQKLVRYGNGAIFLLAIALGSLLCLPLLQKTDLDTEKLEEKIAGDQRALSYEKIGSPPFTFPSTSLDFLLTLLKEQLILGENKRPDVDPSNRKIAIGIKGSGRGVEVDADQLVSFALTEECLPQFVGEDGPFWGKPSFAQSGEMRLKLGVRLIDEEGQSHAKEGEWVIATESQLPFQKGESSAFEEAVRVCRSGRPLGPDPLLEKYGEKSHERIDFDRCSHTPPLHIEQGDYCIWKDGRFSKACPGEETRGYPLALATTLTPHIAVWDIWDETGLQKAEVTQVRGEAVTDSRFRERLSHVKQKRGSRASCRIGDRTLLLKGGDWLIDTPSGWRVVNSLEEIDAIIALKIRRPLFIFAGIEPSEKGADFVGTFFDENRTVIEEISLPIPEKKCERQSPESRANPPSWDDPLPSESSREEGNAMEETVSVERRCDPS